MKPQEVAFRISRFNPEEDEKPHYDSFHVKIDNRMTVLDVLENIKHQRDASLTFRRSCRSGICGSCAMKINRLAKLACKTRAMTEAATHGEVLVEPLGNMPQIKDLVVDMAQFWHENDRGTPWLVWDEMLVNANKENLLTNQQQQVSARLADCIMCGCCFSDCVSRVFDKNFNGPASLAKIHRFVSDPRDKKDEERISPLVRMGLWSCTHCYFCWSQCPRDVRPVAAISALRVMSFNAEDRSQGARHVIAFMDSVERSGMLNEAVLYLRTMRWTTLKDLTLILNAAIKGKAPLPFMRPIPKTEEIQVLYRLTRELKK